MTQVKQKALIVDDEEIIRYGFSRYMAQRGYESTQAASGQEALEKLADQDYAVVLLDVKMPGMSGLEVLSRIRPEHPNTCILMVSALVNADIAAEALRLGADDYITKPCDLDSLSKRLRKALACRRGPRADKRGRG